MKKGIYFSLLLAAGLSIMGCKKEDSDTVDQDKIYTKYILEYNSNQDVTYVRSHFQFSNATGTKLELVDPAQVTANGDIMPFKQALAYYETEINGVASSVDFEYTDTEENVFNNTVNMVPSIDFDGTLDTLSRSSNYMLEWVGDPVQTGEVVTVTIDGNGQGDAQVFTQAGVGATSINLTQDQLGNLGLEDATFYIRRAKTVNASEVTSAGGTKTARYDGTPISVYIEP